MKLIQLLAARVNNMPNQLTFVERAKLAVRAFFDPSLIYRGGDTTLFVDGDLTISATGNISFQSGKHLGFEKGVIYLNSNENEIEAIEEAQEVEILGHDCSCACVCDNEEDCNCACMCDEDAELVAIYDERKAQLAKEAECGCGGCVCEDK